MDSYTYSSAQQPVQYVGTWSSPTFKRQSLQGAGDFAAKSLLQASQGNNSKQNDSDDSVQVVTATRFRGLPWLSIAWRFALALVFSGLLLVNLHMYSLKADLDAWDRRLFTSFTILLSALVSLTLGSLLGVLGACLRWPLLAHKAHSPREVDLVLGMQHPTRTLKLLLHQFGPYGELSNTTLIAMLYLIFNLVSRLSVAVFGVVYNLHEDVHVDYPVMLTDFSNEEWMVPRERNDMYQHRRETERAMVFALEGLMAVQTPFNVTDTSTHNMKNIGDVGLDRTVKDSTVTYTYHLHQYRGLDEYQSSDKRIQSSSSCDGYSFADKVVYHDGDVVARVPNGTETSPNNPQYLAILQGILNTGYASQDYRWAINWTTQMLESPTACATTYILAEGYAAMGMRRGTLFECQTCLTDGHGNPGLNNDLLFNYPQANLSYISNMLLVFPAAFDNNPISFNMNPGQLRFATYPLSSFSPMMNFIANLTDQVAFPHLLQPAHLAARLPILAIIGAQRRLPRVPQEAGASEKPVIITTLQVKWSPAVGVLAGVLGFQVVAVLLTWILCRSVPILDHDSTFTDARVLRTAMNAIQGGSSIASKREIARDIAKAAGNIRYGTRRFEGENCLLYQADVYNDVDRVFPKKGWYL